MRASGRPLVWAVTWHPVSFICVSCEILCVDRDVSVSTVCVDRGVSVSTVERKTEGETDRERDRVPRDCVYLSVS